MSSLTSPPEHESELPQCAHGRSIESVCEFCDGEKIEALEARVEALEAALREMYDCAFPDWDPDEYQVFTSLMIKVGSLLPAKSGAGGETPDRE